MSKILPFSIICLLILVSFTLPFKAYAQIFPGTNSTVSCSTKNILITVDSPDNNLTDKPNIIIGDGRPLGINVKIPEITAQPNWGYYVVILAHPDLGTERATTYDTPIRGDSPTKKETIGGVTYNVYHWDLNNILKSLYTTSQFIEYIVELKHAEPGPGNIRTFGADICLGPEKQIKTVNYSLSQVDSCPLTMSDTFNSHDSVTGSVTLKQVNNVTYGYKLYEGDISKQIPIQPLSPIPLTQMPGFSPGWGLGFDDQTHALNAGAKVALPSEKKDNNTYTAVIYAASTEGSLVPLVFSCGYRVITVNNGVTTPPNTKGGTTIQPGGNQIVNPAPDKCIVPDTPGCSKSAGDPCPLDPEKGPGFKTAIGCIHTQPKALVEDVLKFATGIGGGLAFMMMLLGAFQMLTSGGNPQNLQGGKDVLQNALIGLLFIIFSILLMKIIGIDILSLPGFN